jgi:hypothetical protein
VGKYHSDPGNRYSPSPFWRNLGQNTRGGFAPVVQAYPWKLRLGERGIEFTTEIAPHPMGSPFEARWYLNLTPGVELRQKGGEDYACIKAVVENHQQ